MLFFSRSSGAWVVGIINRREREPTVSYGERSRNGVRMSWRREKMEFYDCFINKFIASAKAASEVGKLLNNHRCGIVERCSPPSSPRSHCKWALESRAGKGQLKRCRGVLTLEFRALFFRQINLIKSFYWFLHFRNLKFVSNCAQCSYMSRPKVEGGRRGSRGRMNFWSRKSSARLFAR